MHAAIAWCTCLLAVLALTLPALQALAFAALSGCGLALVTPCVVSIIAGGSLRDNHVLTDCCCDMRTVDCSWRVEQHIWPLLSCPSPSLVLISGMVQTYGRSMCVGAHSVQCFSLVPWVRTLRSQCRQGRAHGAAL